MKPMTSLARTAQGPTVDKLCQYLQTFIPLKTADVPFLYHVPGIIWLFLKIAAFFFIFSWVKATVPRYRYDQLMRLGWKIFLPLSLIWVFLVSGYLMVTRYGMHP